MRRGIALIMCCLGLVACGGSSGSGSTKSVAGPTATTSSPAANAAFAHKLSSICKKANAAYIAASKPSAQVAVIQRYLKIFQALKAPASLDSAYALYLAVLSKELRALKKGNSAGLAKIRDTQAGPLVRQLGATGCYG
jgi:membrane-bound lytic murein transglycosylase B